jgi:hypothetical protein
MRRFAPDWKGAKLATEPRGAPCEALRLALCGQAPFEPDPGSPAPQQVESGAAGGGTGCQVTNLESGSFAVVDRDLENWAFLDIGFAGSSKSSSGLLLPGEDRAIDLTWADACTQLVHAVALASRPTNLMVEAPLSMAFDARGNPAGRAFEKRDSQTRYWYQQGGAVTLLAASMVLHRLHRAAKYPVRLFEAFISFKTEPSSHSADAELMRRAIGEPTEMATAVKLFERDEIVSGLDHRLVSSTFESGLDFGIPPVFVFSNRPS